MNSERCSQCKHFIIANVGEGNIYGCDRSKCVFDPTDKNFTKADIDAIVKAINEHWELIIDEIRAEIEQLSTSTCTETRRIYIDADDFKGNVLAILDKYKAEMEDT